MGITRYLTSDRRPEGGFECHRQSIDSFVCDNLSALTQVLMEVGRAVQQTGIRRLSKSRMPREPHVVCFLVGWVYSWAALVKWCWS